jgi:hypothetical protein
MATQFPQYALLQSVECVQFRLTTILGNCGCVAVASFLGVPSPLNIKWPRNWRSFINKFQLVGRGHTKETGNRTATAIAEKCRRFQAGNWFPDQQAHIGETYVQLVAHIILCDLKYVCSSDVVHDCIFNKTMSYHPFALTRALRKFRRHISERVASYSQSSGSGLYYVNQIRLLSRIVRCYSTAATSTGSCTENCKYSIRPHKAQLNYGIEKGKLWN